MYLIFGIFLFLCILFIPLNYCRKKRIIRRICAMDTCEKICKLNDILEPFGFTYEHSQEIITSRRDAWQKQFGYCALYDKTASKFGMVFHCEPIYFHYRERTWMIEFWKGQYGVNLGCETGIYHADTVLSPEQYGHTLFHSVPDSQMLPMSMSLYHKGSLMFQTSQKHWWLTGFQTGKFCEPENLTMCVSITFPNAEMLQAFVGGLLHTGYQICDLNICDLTVTFTFCLTHTKQPCKCKCLLIAYVQWKNQLFCRLFQWVTRCFTCMLDKILYLYFFLPVFCRRMLRLKRNRKQKFRRKDRRRHEL